MLQGLHQLLRQGARSLRPNGLEDERHTLITWDDQRRFAFLRQPAFNLAGQGEQSLPRRRLALNHHDLVGSL